MQVLLVLVDKEVPATYVEGALRLACACLSVGEGRRVAVFIAHARIVH